MFDSLYKIAYAYGITAQELASYNQLTLESELETGSEIKIPVTKEVSEFLAKVDTIIKESGKYFRAGLYNMQDNRRSQAGEDFNKSVEVFLMSGLNVNRKQQLLHCFNHLIETVYRIEFPSGSQPPQIRSLSATCGWTIDNELADKVAKIVLTAPVAPTNADTALITSAAGQTNQTQGFNEQKFEASPLDELTKLDLTQEIRKVSKSSKQIQSSSNNLQIVKARSGDTIAKLAKREGFSAVEIAKLNGLLPGSILKEGREVKIPKRFHGNIPTSLFSSESLEIIVPQKSNLITENSIGKKPTQAKDGKVPAVMNYFNENYNDPYSMRFVRWSDIEKRHYQKRYYWAVQVKFRAKNTFNAYVLIEEVFYIWKDKVVKTQRLN